MRTVFIALGIYHGVGGLERFNQRLVRCLGELGDKGLEGCAVALWDQPGDATADGGRVSYLPCGSSKPAAAATFLNQVWRRQPEVILYGHVLLAPLAVAARLASPRSRHLLLVHGREVWREPFREHIPRWERLVVQRAIDCVASVSRLTARRMGAAYGVEESRFRLLPNAVDPPPEAPSPRSCIGEPRLLTVTRLSGRDRYKGCDKVIRALPRLLTEFPGLLYQVVGEGPLRLELERLAEELGVRRAVRFLGYIDDTELERVYGGAHVMVLPSTGEGFGIVFLEAWKHGLPVVAGNRDASAEVVTDGVTGRCVDPESVGCIAEALLGLLRDPESAGRMGQQGYQTLLERYTHNHFRENLWRILQS